MYKDKYLVAVNKYSGTPSLPDKSGDPSLIEISSKSIKATLFPVNRLDRPTSGIVLYAKSSKAATRLSLMWKQETHSKTYLAAVRNAPQPDSGTLRHFLNKKHNKSYITTDQNHGKEAILEYESIGKTDHYTILRIKLLTGRFHQIRAQLAHIGSPIKGDVKYGDKRANKNRSIHLHAWKMSFVHPFTNEEINLEAELPYDPVWNYFRRSDD